MTHPAFARKRLETEILSAGVADNAEDAGDFLAPDCLAGLAILLGNRARNGKPNGDVPVALRDLLAAEGVTLPRRAEGALRFAEAHAPDGGYTACCYADIMTGSQHDADCDGIQKPVDGGAP